MTLPLYFAQDPAAPPTGRVAGIGWYCEPDGSLHSPEAARIQALVLDDRNPLPERFDALLASLLAQAESTACEVIVLDFERPATDNAIRFARALSERFRTAAPLPCCGGSCEPILCYSPSSQTFPEFLHQLRGPCWAELRPVDETVYFPSDSPPSGEGAFFSEALQCHYRAASDGQRLILRLFDTPESFQRRFARMSSRLTAAIGLGTELNAYGIQT